MNHLKLFLPCAAGVEDLLAQEVQHISGQPIAFKARAGVGIVASWRDALQLNLHSRLAQRVLVQLWHGSYRHENDLYHAASAVSWEAWFGPEQTIKVEITAQHSPLNSLNFAALKIKDAICDRLRAKKGNRPSVDTTHPDVRIHAHLTTEDLTLYIDTSGEPLFKRGWRHDTGDAPLKETLAAAIITATGWGQSASTQQLAQLTPLYDPCCGSGTLLIEAAQIALHIAPGLLRRFAFEKLLPFAPHVWSTLKDQAQQAQRIWPAGQPPLIFGSDVSFRMVDFAQRNAHRAGVAHAIELRAGDALQRKPPCAHPGIMVLNPPYGQRIAAAGVAGENAAQRAMQRPAQGWGRQNAYMGQHQPHQPREDNPASEFFEQLAAHWKSHYAGWSAWVLTPELKLPGQMRLRESRRVPLWNGPLECRLFRFDITARLTQPGSV